jgi:hypothetical protein
MTQEEKLLLLKDLCARLPYGVIVDNPNPAGGMWDEVINIDTSTKTVTLLYNGRVFGIDNIKPYLRPMLSMTEDEENEYRAINCYEGLFPRNEDALDYALEHHLDFRNLIEKGLALEAPDNMYKTE